MARDPVPEADRLEQEMLQGPDVPDERGTTSAHRLPPETPEADAVEQDLPLARDLETLGVDAERSEPVSDEDWAEPPDEGTADGEQWKSAR